MLAMVTIEVPVGAGELQTRQEERVITDSSLLRSFSGGLRRGKLSIGQGIGWIAVAGSVLALAGCGGTSNSSSSNPVPGAPYQSNLTSSQLCSRLTPGALSPIIKATWGTTPTPGPSTAGVASCTISTQDVVGQVLSVQIDQLNGAVSFQDKLKNNALQLKQISGVGDQAAFSSLPAGTGSTNTLVVEKGKSLFVIVLVSPRASTGHEQDSLKNVYDLVSS
jgi:hypothetical protein